MVQIGVRMPHYTEEQKKIALGMLDGCGSVTEATRRLGYPSRSVFYHWARNDDAAGRRAEGKIFSHYPAGIREEAIRLAGGGLGDSEVACVPSSLSEPSTSSSSEPWRHGTRAA